MNKNLCLVLVFGLAAVMATPACRFVNALEGANVDIHSTEFDTIHLNYAEASSYQASTTGQVHVTNVVDSTSGNSYTNGESLLIQFTFDATIAIIEDNGQVVLALFNETFPGSIDTSKAYIRVLDLASSSEFVNFATIAGTFAAYVGPMVATQFYAVDPSTTDLRVFDSATGSYNAPMVDSTISVTAGNAYTYFYFTPASGASGTFAFDHTVSGAVIPPATSTSSSTSAKATSTSGVQTSTSGVQATSTSGVQSTSTSGIVEQSSTSVRVNSSAQVGVVALLSVVAAIFAF